jgi:hypothetical protein
MPYDTDTGEWVGKEEEEDEQAVDDEKIVEEVLRIPTVVAGDDSIERDPLSAAPAHRAYEHTREPFLPGEFDVESHARPIDARVRAHGTDLTVIRAMAVLHVPARAVSDDEEDPSEKSDIPLLSVDETPMRLDSEFIVNSSDDDEDESSDDEDESNDDEDFVVLCDLEIATQANNLEQAPTPPGDRVAIFGRRPLSGGYDDEAIDRALGDSAVVIARSLGDVALPDEHPKATQSSSESSESKDESGVCENGDQCYIVSKWVQKKFDKKVMTADEWAHLEEFHPEFLPKKKKYSATIAKRGGKTSALIAFLFEICSAADTFYGIFNTTSTDYVSLRGKAIEYLSTIIGRAYSVDDVRDDTTLLSHFPKLRDILEKLEKVRGHFEESADETSIFYVLMFGHCYTSSSCGFSKWLHHNFAALPLPIEHAYDFFLETLAHDNARGLRHTGTLYTGMLNLDINDGMINLSTLQSQRFISASRDIATAKAFGGVADGVGTKSLLICWLPETRKFFAEVGSFSLQPDEEEYIFNWLRMKSNVRLRVKVLSDTETLKEVEISCESLCPEMEARGVCRYHIEHRDKYECVPEADRNVLSPECRLHMEQFRHSFGHEKRPQFFCGANADDASADAGDARSPSPPKTAADRKTVKKFIADLLADPSLSTRLGEVDADPELRHELRSTTALIRQQRSAPCVSLFLALSGRGDCVPPVMQAFKTEGEARATFRDDERKDEYDHKDNDDRDLGDVVARLPENNRVMQLAKKVAHLIAKDVSSLTESEGEVYFVLGDSLQQRDIGIEVFPSKQNYGFERAILLDTSSISVGEEPDVDK